MVYMDGWKDGRMTWIPWMDGIDGMDEMGEWYTWMGGRMGG